MSWGSSKMDPGLTWSYLRFEALLSETMSLGECLGFLSALVSDVDLGSDKSKVTRQWAREQTKLALQSCSSPVIEDAPALATVACVEGVTYYLNEWATFFNLCPVKTNSSLSEYLHN